jgi:peptidase A4-like protein
MRPPRYLLVPGSAALLAGALTLTAGCSATVAGPARAGHAPHSARFVSAARDALARYLRHSRLQAVFTGHPRAAGKGIAQTASFDWSGYADGGTKTKKGTFTKVSGSWVAPGVKCGAEDQLTVDWVGLDGLHSSSIEQAGTMAWCYEGAPLYFTWWEMSPTGKGLKEVGNTLQPGDRISASVARSGTTYTLKLTDSTSKSNSFRTKQTCPAATCPDTSAEWIAERPAFANVGFAPLVHYTAFQITDGSQRANGKSGTIGSYSSVSAITMVDATDAYNLNNVSALSKGDRFSTTWRNSW